MIAANFTTNVTASLVDSHDHGHAAAMTDDHHEDEHATGLTVEPYVWYCLVVLAGN